MKQMHKPPKYCQGFEDRHGKVRWYYRRPGFPRVALPGLPWSPDFMAAYEKAAVGERLETGASRSKPGTVAASRKNLAARAMLALGKATDETATVKPAEAV